MVVIPKPPNINDWLVWGNFVESVLLDFKPNVYNEKEKRYEIEIEHRPSNLMQFVHQIDWNKEKDYNKATHRLVSRFPMTMVGDTVSRIGGGTYVFMLCDYHGNPTNIIERINKSLLQKYESLRKEVITLNALLIREKQRTLQIVKHPEEFQKEFIQQLRDLKKATGPAVVGGVPVEGVEDSGED